jgi:drug/metabolite transporter (DMT)-like permease
VSHGRSVSVRIEGLALVLFTACSWGMAWPISKFLLTMLPPYSMRAISGLMGCVLAFAVATMRGEKLWPPRDQWRGPPTASAAQGASGPRCPRRSAR